MTVPSPQKLMMMVPQGGLTLPHPPGSPIYQGENGPLPAHFHGFSPGSINEGKMMSRLLELKRENEEIIKEMRITLGELKEKERAYREEEKAHREEMQRVMNSLLDKERKIMQLEDERIEWQKAKENMELKMEIEQQKKGKTTNDIERTVKEVIRKEWSKNSSNGESTTDLEQEVKRISNEFENWKAKNEQDKVSLKQIMTDEMVAQRQSFKDDVVNVLKSNGPVVRDMAEQKKCVVLFGIKEEKNSDKVLRERYELNKIKNILSRLGDDWMQGEIDKIVRLGRFEEGRDRPVKLRLYSQAAAEEILRNSWKLKEQEPYKKVYIRRNMTEEERDKMNEMLSIAKQRNDDRTDEERLQFFWKVKNEKLRKWWIRETERDH